MATTLAPAAVAAEEDYQLQRHLVWRRFRRHRLALAGGVVFGLMILVAILANVIAPWDPNYIDQAHWTGYPLAPGVAGH
ncbi:MAG: ABC transporter permease, partial [Candidatus Eremiobacteraeota bacterium]|nr:ABC transporter permease [Candidatus Eremiobacteraeota bacterium]